MERKKTMPDFTRDLEIIVDGNEIARGCRLRLTAETTLGLRPPPYKLEILDLSESSAALLPGGRRLEVTCGINVLSAGEITEVVTRTENGRRLTTVIFSPGLSLWGSAVSLAVPSGMKVSDSIRRLLEASGTDVPLAAFAADDIRLYRPQAFYGRTCDALSLLAETAGADVFFGTAGVCVSGRSPREAMYTLNDKDLLSEPFLAGNRMVISTEMTGWTPGTWIRVTWQGAARNGRIRTSLVQADNREGPWKTELELELA